MKAPLPPNEAQRLKTLHSYNVLDTLPEQAFDDLVKLAAQICQVPIAVVSLIDETRQWFKSITGLDVTETSRDIAFCAHTILNSEELLEVYDAQIDLRFADNPLVTGDPNIRFYAGAPLVAPNGLALGALCVIDHVPRELSSDQQAALHALSRIVINQLELRRTLTDYNRVEEPLKSLNSLLEQKVDERTAELRQEMAIRIESEERFRQLSENINEVFWMTDLDKEKMLYVSPVYEQVWGRTVQSLYDSPRNWLEAIHVEDRERVFKAARTIQATGLYDEEYRIFRPNGAIRWIHDKASPVRNSEGVVYRLVGVAEDITERKQQVEQTRQLLIEKEMMLDNALVGIVYLKRQRIVSCNHLMEEIFQYGPGELMGESAERLYDSRESFEQIMKAAYQAAIVGKNYMADLKLRHKDGSPFWCALRARIVDTTHSNEGSIWIYTDITDRKEVEAELRVAATVFESHESLMVTDANRVILRVNQAFIDETGYKAEEVVGKTPRMLSSGRHKAKFYGMMWDTIRRTGMWQGEIWDRRKNGEIYPKWLTISSVKGVGGVVTHYIGSHTDITERKKTEEKIQYLGHYDALTHLPNRRFLMERIHQALISSLRIGREGTLLFIDMDHFKNLNDTMGHYIGDLFLQQVAKRLVSCVREGDTVARLGGDEFVMILENLSGQALEAAAQTEAIGQKILTSISQPYNLAGHVHHGTASIGAVLFHGHQQAIDEDELLKQADIAMYQAKKSGRNCLRFFDPEMQKSISARVALEIELRQALEQQQFQLYYQVQVDQYFHPLGAEALIRWSHPERGLVFPLEFIPLADETGLIIPIGQWVLETACAQLKVWQQDAGTRDLVLSINVSAKQLHQVDFVAQVQSAIRRHAINPERLKMELTESMLLENIEETIATMNEIKEMGVQFSLDDFGTGYSSLQYLKRLPLNQLKIDRSFVRDIVIDSSDKAIVRTIVAMARSLDISVIGEGVEMKEQQQLLLAVGCSNYQGYLFGRPLPIEQFEVQLRSMLG